MDAAGKTIDARTRTYSWQDPMIGARTAASMSGLEYLTAIAQGKLPPAPIADTLGMTWSDMEIAPGRVAFFLDVQEFHFNPIGSVHGGVISTILDSAMACAIQTKLPAGVGYTTLELKVNFTRALRMDSGRLRCEGNVLAMGRQVATSEGKLVDAQGRLCAHATTTCLILQPRG